MTSFFSHRLPLPAVAVSTDADVLNSENKWMVKFAFLSNFMDLSTLGK
jgi:hypothetical protein